MPDLELVPESAEDGTASDQSTDVEQGPGMLEALAAPNLVPLLNEADVNRIGSDALREFETDLGTCKEFHAIYDRAMDVAMQRTKPKTFPWTNASNVVFPLLTQAAIQFHARAYPAIIDGGEVVKGKVIGPDPDGKKAERAERIGQHMTWQFLNDVPGWEEDTDKLLLQLPIVGCVFRETWRDEVRAQNNSETFSAKDLVINIATTSLDKAPRYTRIKRYYPHEIEAFVRSDLWAKVPYEGDDGSDPHSLVIVYEQFRLIDMDDDGLAEPYIVTLTEQGHVFRIVACYDAEGMFFTSSAFDGQMSLADIIAGAKDEAGQSGMDMGDLLPPDMRLIRIQRREYITKYGFIPAPDGTFFDIGFGTLTDALGAAVNTIINQLIDAGTLANMQGGFLAGGTKIRGGNMRFTPGEWKRVDGVTSGALRDNILPLQLPGPNATLFQLLGMLIDSVKGITSVSDIMTGEQDSQTAPTTALALIEQGQKVFTAIYQRIHRAFGGEIKIMKRLNRDYLDVLEYFNLNDCPIEVGRADYQDRDLDVQPVSDPRAINDRVKMAKAQVLMSHNGDPLVNQMEIRKREFEAAGIADIPALLEVPKPGPDPAALAQMADLETKRAVADADVRSKDATTAKALIDAAAAAYALGTSVADANIQADATRMLNEGIALADSVAAKMKGPDDAGQPAVQPGGVPEVGGSPADGGVPPVPQGPGADAGDAMGAGGGPIGQPGDDAGAGTGGDAGGPGAPVM